MKVLQINKYHYLRGGADRVFFNTLALLNEKGHQTAPFCINHPLNLPSPYDKYFVDAPEIRQMNTWKRIKAVPRFFWNDKAPRQLDALLNDFRPDVAHLHNIFNGVSLSILPVLKRHNIPIILTVHEPRFVCPSSKWQINGAACDKCRKGWYLNCLRKRCCEGSIPLSAIGMFEMIHKDYLLHASKSIDKFIFLNHSFREIMGKEHPEMIDRGVVLPNFSPEIELHNSSRGNYFLMYGRLTSEKGIATFIEMAKMVPDAKFVVAGSGEMEKDLLEANLPNVEYRGFITGSELAETILDSSMILVPSECMDNNPMTIIEAFSYGKPVIATNIGGIPDMVIPGKTGWLIPTFSPHEFAQAIREAEIISDELYSKMSRDASSFALENYNKEGYYKRLINIYSDTIKEYQTR